MADIDIKKNVGADANLKMTTSGQEAWYLFKPSDWCTEINVREFIQLNYIPYKKDASFLAGPTEKTNKLFALLNDLFKKERDNGGTLDVDVDNPSSITAHKPGYIDKNLEEIVGIQTDAPLRRAIMPFGGIRLVDDACKSYGFELNPKLKEIFTKYRKTHNEGVFALYNEQIRAARRSGIITGLPDAYGRGRIIGDYRRVALYGLDILIKDKIEQKESISIHALDEENMRQVEELTEQIKALHELKEMGASYGFDLSKPARNAKEAIQWLYFGYLAAIKEQDGAAMSLGRTSTFLDIYIERDIREGILTEEQAQELIDHFVMKLRMVRFLRPPAYNELFSGDPVWVTEVIGGQGIDGRTLVTKNSFRMLHTLYNLSPAPEPNLTVLWSNNLPRGFKEFCAQISIDTSSIQYENDDLMRYYYGDDYGIACCVSAMKIGKQMQFFGARCNLAKTLLYSINGGRDEKSGAQVGPVSSLPEGEYLDYDDVVKRFDSYLDWIAELYISALNKIHYMHDKYAYEKLEFALHDKDIMRTMACGIAGLSVVADSLSAIKYSKVKAIRNEEGIAVDFERTTTFPCFGNDDDRVDTIAKDLVKNFMNKLRRHKTYRNSVPTQSILTITSNVVYGKKTGTTPDGRLKGEPFGPGANPMHGRDSNGAIASMASLAKLPYQDALDGISYTFSTVPSAIGRTREDRINNLVNMLDGYFKATGHHINVNVFDRDTLIEAMEHPEMYPQLTVRVSGYAVNFIKLTRDQQQDVINRTFHKKM